MGLRIHTGGIFTHHTLPMPVYLVAQPSYEVLRLLGLSPRRRVAVKDADHG